MSLLTQPKLKHITTRINSIQLKLSQNTTYCKTKLKHFDSWDLRAVPLVVAPPNGTLKALHVLDLGMDDIVHLRVSSKNVDPAHMQSFFLKNCRLMLNTQF